MKLDQNQVWKKGDEYFRIVHWERLEIHYKQMNSLLNSDGSHHKVSKKEFCRLIKGATLLSPDEIRTIWRTTPLPDHPE